MAVFIALTVLLIIILFFLTVMIIDCHSLVVRCYEFKSSKVKKPISAVLLTDLHSSSFGKGNSRLISKINNLKPDVILISGDMFTAEKYDDNTVALMLITELAQKYPVFYANGNHELKTRENTDEFGDRFRVYKDILLKAGVRYLENESEYLEDSNVRICGLDLPFYYYKKKYHPILKKENLEELLGTAPKEETSILLAHNPEYFEGYSEWGADLVLSGHYHGGLMRLPGGYGAISPRFILFTKLGYGVFKNRESEMILSCGLGTHTLPVRIFNPGEISFIKISGI